MKTRKGIFVTQEEFNECMARIKSGDKEGLKYIYTAYLSYIYTIVYGIVNSKENAEDITSEFFIKLWDIADQYKAAENGHKAYLATVARNMALDFLRKNKTQNRFVPDWIETNNGERLKKLSTIIQQWMESKIPQQATAAILQIAQSRKSVLQLPKQEKNAQLLEEKFKKENFDLIVWEYVSK